MTLVSPSDSDDTPTPWLALGGMTAALAAFGLGQGQSYPLFSLLMERQGYEPSLIGLSAAMMPLGLIVSAGLVPATVRWIGAPALAITCALLAALGFLTIALLHNWVGWFVVRFLLGFAINPLYILGETWALGLAPPKRRGPIMGIFNTVMSAGYACGPLALMILGTVGWPPFIAAISGFVLCALILFLVRRQLPGFDSDEPDAAEGVVAFARIAPALLAATCVSAAVQQSNYSLLPLFGAGYGLATALIALLVMVLSLGNIFLQIPLGMAAARFGARQMVLTCAAATALAAALLPIAVLSDLKWPLLLVMGGFGYGIHTMTLVELGNRFRGRTLVAGNAALALMWGVGGIIGPPSAGTLMQAVGPLGLTVTIVTLCLALIAFSAYRLRQRQEGENP